MIRLSAALLALGLLSSPARSEEEPPARIWSDSAEFSFVLTGGNSETLSLGLKNELKGQWPKQSFAFRIAALRAEDTETTRLAIGDVDDFNVESSKDTDLTAESFEAGLRFDRKLNERQAWFVDGSWLRNEFSGIRNRVVGLTGLATTWKDAERLRFRTDVGLSWTRQDDVVEDPTRDDSWLGFRFGWELWTKVGKNGEYGNDVAFDLNLDETDDMRVDMTNWFAVSFTERLAVKLSHQLKWDNQPSLELIDLFDPADLGTPIGSVPVELESTDTLFSAALLVRW